ncbi:unnamed protein product, partial [Timema podura]|nr:unnamed protein product [Timema podura]
MINIMWTSNKILHMRKKNLTQSRSYPSTLYTSSPGLFGMPEANTSVPMSAPLVTSFGSGSSQQSSPGLFGMPQANMCSPLSTPGMTSFGFG